MTISDDAPSYLEAIALLPNGTLEKMKPLLRLGVGVWGCKGIGSSYDAARQVLLLI
ncbi:hypothetical protein COO91_01047 [Nostoc flagelliforme CCNUN1]|uniref:Uncharacterized protein n=1 Tax=Nostoc flagelliforme CCNUN1 TaxID=2038116 RepID=A0A2K8SIA1_9NOSO|nr:hypothetical protein [Nostoc flagelliforme]AUB35182.1 hypothetical protein COO91_01047 [Nostoc flagelliforme CCNUN1]